MRCLRLEMVRRLTCGGALTLEVPIEAGDCVAADLRRSSAEGACPANPASGQCMQGGVLRMLHIQPATGPLAAACKGWLMLGIAFEHWPARMHTRTHAHKDERT